MKMNVLSVDIFVATPGVRTSYFRTAIEAVRDVNACVSADSPIVFNTRHWTDLQDTIIPEGENGQSVINPLLDSCDLALVIFGDQMGSSEGGKPKTYEEFLRARENSGGRTRVLLALSTDLDAQATEVLDAAKEQIFYRKFATQNELKEQIKSFLRDRINDFMKSELFLTMPMFQAGRLPTEDAYLVTNSNRLIHDVYPGEKPTYVRGCAYPYVSLFEVNDDAQEMRIKEVLSKCRVEKGSFEVGSFKTSTVRQKLLQAQFLLLLAYWKRFKDNGLLTRFVIRQRDQRAVIQETTYLQQVISNMALFWPNSETEWSGKSGLSQEFKFAEDGDFPQSTRDFLGPRWVTLHQLINSVGASAKLPAQDTVYLANTLGVAALVLYFNDDGQPVLLLEERNEQAAIYTRGFHMLISAALSWPTSASDHKTFDLWTFIENDIRARVLRSLEKIDPNARSKFDIITSPMFLGREMMRGGKPQLFVVSVLSFNDDSLRSLVRERFAKVGYLHPDEIVRKPDVTEEFRFAAALYVLHEPAIRRLTGRAER